MNQKPFKGLVKHADFIIIDLLCLQMCFILAHWIIVDIQNPYSIFTYRYLAIVMILGQLLTIVFANNYSGIIRRGRLDEFISVLQFTVIMLALSLVLLFVFKSTGSISRLQTGLTIVLYLIIDYGGRQLRKKWLYRKSANSENRLGHSLILITTGELVDDAMERLTEYGMYRTHFVAGIIVTDGDVNAIKVDHGVPIVPLDGTAIRRLRSRWVDEVFYLQADDEVINKELMDTIMDMGITVHICPQFLSDKDWPKVEMRKLGQYKVLTSSIKFVSPDRLIAKRIMDIIGGIVGCIITGLLCLFVGPAIYSKDPGPIFFKQERIGLNGKPFMIYKFRSMYMDAEERKAALMEQNKIDDNRMFKMDDDPRIIGSEKKGKDGKPKGIGNFIRRTSIDEFPQFFNVLKGDMSLVGTRPPLPAEWEQYDIHHRARMTVKPGITGLWQVSGRSTITDFDEVVRLDLQYIENWSFREDIRILLKTVAVVVKGSGAK